MDRECKINMFAVTLDCKEPDKLASFYADLLQWEVVFCDESYTIIAPPGIAPGAYPGITFQCNPAYQSPVWPERPEMQQQMVHIDFAVDDLDRAVRYAVGCGATVAEEQFSDDWQVLFDPCGHPFCLCKGIGFLS